MGKLMALCLVLALWRPIVVAIPLVYYGIPALRALTRRLLYSVRAKLAAFYLYAALLPILVAATVLLFVGYVALGQTSARLVEQRLERHVAWGERCVQRAQLAYWQARARGATAQSAARTALQSGWSDAPTELSCWVRSGDEVLAARGALRPAD